MDIDVIEHPDPERLPNPEPIVHTGNCPTTYPSHLFHDLVDLPDPD